MVMGVATHLLPLVQAEDSAKAEPAGIEFFEKRIRPVLVRECYSCHAASSSEIKGQLRVDSREAIRRGGESGPAVVPGVIGKSLLIDAIEHRTLEMPPKKKLSPRVIADFRRWIQLGAPDPRDRPPSPDVAAQQAWDLVLAERRNWWSLQPVAAIQVPEVKGDKWSRDSIDRFVLSRLQKEGLGPARDAEPLVLLRRISLILTGLPPEPKLVRSFPAAWSRDPDAALEAVVDQFLRSRHYGERLARHWMDVVRYTDTYGYEWDNPARGSWEYRDYLIRAFNNDVSFDQLILEQVAGDLLPRARIGRESGLNESLIGPMFYHMGEHRHGDNVRINGVREEMIDNKIDAFSKAFLATTIACARCHDHKRDAVSQRDYYALAGMFMTPRWIARSIEAPGTHDADIQRLKSLRGKVARELKRAWLKQAQRLPGDLVTWLGRTGDKSAKPGTASDAWNKAVYGAEGKVGAARAMDLAKAGGIDGLAQLLSQIHAAETDKQAIDAWKTAAAQWKRLHDGRAVANQKAFRSLGDVRGGAWPDGWLLEGAGAEHGHVTDGTPLVALDGDKLISRLLPAGLHTHALSSKLPGAVRMPLQQQVDGKHVSVLLAGGEWSGSIRMADNAFQTEAITFLDRPRAAWQRFDDIKLVHGIQRVSYDLVTSDLNPNFPPRTGLARAGETKLPDNDLGVEKRSWFSVTGLVVHDTPGTPSDELARYRSLFVTPPPTTRNEAAHRVGLWLQHSVAAWSAGRGDADDVQVINWLVDNQLLENRLNEDSDVGEWVKEYRRAEADIAYARTVNSLDEREVPAVNYPLNIRGSIHDRGPRIPRRFLQVFRGQTPVSREVTEGSGRLTLAKFLADGKHGLAARVYVNRLWQWVFGQGLVRTPSDFGRLGELPSHPRLLDHLAREFIRGGWSTRSMLKRLVLSRVFRQSGVVAERAREHDPSNRLLHHFATRRLEAEAIRDSLLAVSGRLDPKLFGRPINPHRHVEDGAKRLYSGPLDGHGRRSIYLNVSIMAPSTFLLNFNFPDPKLPAGRRDVTNVPAQALVLMNNPFVVSLADHWASELVQDGSASPPDRIERMFVRALGRVPSASESREWVQLANTLAGPGVSDVMKDQVTWKDVAHTLINTKEFLYFR